MFFGFCSNSLAPRTWSLPRANPPELATAENPQLDPNDSLSDISSTFFQDLDDQLNANYDPIHELDSIIDNEDISSLFNDASDDLPSNSEPFDVVNPRVRRF